MFTYCSPYAILFVREDACDGTLKGKRKKYFTLYEV
jgi:hypothetical protein